MLGAINATNLLAQFFPLRDILWIAVVLMLVLVTTQWRCPWRFVPGWQSQYVGSFGMSFLV